MYIPFRSEQEDSGVRDSGVREGPLGGMRGVKVTKTAPGSGPAGVGGGLQQAAPAKGGPPATKSTSPPLAPPSIQPVELFLRDSNTGGRGRGVGGAGGGGMSLLPPRITTETAKNEIQWHTWRLECHIKKVSTTISQLTHSLYTQMVVQMVEALNEENGGSFGTKIQELLSSKYTTSNKCCIDISFCFNSSSSEFGPKADLLAGVSRPRVASPLVPTG